MHGSQLRWGTRRYVDVDGLAVHVETAGPPDGPVLACLHGFGSGTFTWAGVAPLLAPRLHVVAWDRPPFGRSDRPPPRRGRDPYAPAEERRRTGKLVRHLVADGRRLVLVGHSAGALLAVEAVSAGDVRPDALVLIAPALRAGPPAVVRAMSRLPGTEVAGPAALRLALLATEPALRAGGRHRSAVTDATAAESARTLRRRGTATALWHMTRTWTPSTLGGRLDLLGVPLTVIAGAEDRIVPLAPLRQLLAGTDAELHVLAGVGHAPQEQVPGVVADVLAQVAGGPAGR